MDDDSKKKARARALRAARAVTIAAALVMGPAGCAMSHEGGDDAGRAEDAGEIPLPDSGIADAFVPGHDAGPPRDGGTCPMPTWTSCCEPIPEHCCTPVGWWDDAQNCCVTCVVGPLVPPSAPV